MLSEADYPQEERIVCTSLTAAYNIGAVTCNTWPRPASWGSSLRGGCGTSVVVGGVRGEEVG